MVVYLSFAFLLALFSAYTSKFQQATNHWGRIVAGEKSIEAELDEIKNMDNNSDKKAFILGKSPFNRGSQDAITPKMQTIRNIASGLGYLLILIIGFYFFKWYIPLITLGGVFFFKANIKNAFPSVNSLYFKNKIIRSLQKRAKMFYQNHDFNKLEAAEYFITSLKESSSDLN